MYQTPFKESCSNRKAYRQPFKSSMLNHVVIFPITPSPTGSSANTWMYTVEVRVGLGLVIRLRSLICTAGPATPLIERSMVSRYPGGFGHTDSNPSHTYQIPLLKISKNQINDLKLKLPAYNSFPQAHLLSLPLSLSLYRSHFTPIYV